MKFKVITFALLIPLLTLNEAQSSCEYSQYLDPQQTYYVYNPEYPNCYHDKNQCTWRMMSNLPVKINCTINMSVNANCNEEYLSIQSAGKNMDKYCGSGTFEKEVMGSFTMNFISPPYTKGCTFLCQVQAFDKYKCQCGWKNPSLAIVGGKETGINEYPMMAGLVDAQIKELYCGATIISQRHVVTAAHCVDRKNISNIGVLVGEHDVTTGADTSAAKLYRINKWTIHPQYYDTYNDIAVCEIIGTIQYTDKVGPVCLPFQHRYDSFDGSKVTVLGWGMTEFGGPKASALQGADLTVISNSQCANYYDEITYGNLCTYTPGKDACQMDSGGPALWDDSKTRNMVLVGIISAGKGCATPDVPSIYTRVTSYIDWIVSVTPGVQYCKTE